MAFEWPVTTVEAIASPTRNALVGGPFGSNLVSRDYVDGGVPVIRGQNMGGRWLTGEFAFVTEEKANSLQANLARPGDIILTQRGTLGQVCLVPDWPYDRYLVSQSQMKLTVDRRVADPRFFYYVFTAADQQEYIRQHAIQTGVPHTNLGILRATPVVLPPLKVQRAIADVLGALDDKIELNRWMSETLERIASACFSRWFSRGGRRNDDAGTGVARDIVEFDPTERLKRGTVAPHLGLAELPTVGPIHQPSRLRPFTSGARFRNRDTLLARITPSLENGKTALANGLPHDSVAWGSTEIIVMRARQGVPFSVPYLLARDASFRARAVRSMSGTSGRQRVPREALEDEPISIPPKHRLVEFGELVDPMFDAMFAKARESETLAAIRDALLPKLISGGLRVPDAERVVGEVV